MEYWLSAGCYSVLSTRSSVRVVDVVDVDVADVEVALVVVSVDVVVVVCTKNSERLGHFNKAYTITNHPGVQFKKAVCGPT